jgi:hypothetical protein
VPAQDPATPPPPRRNRDFLLLWSGQVVSTIGTRVSSLAYPLLVLALTGSPAEAGIAGSAQTLPFLLLPAGALVDRWNRKWVMPVPTAALPNVVPQPQLATTVAQNQARDQGADLAGQPLGGVLFGVSQLLPFAVDAASYAVSFTTLLLRASRSSSGASAHGPACARRSRRRSPGSGGSASCAPSRC